MMTGIDVVGLNHDPTIADTTVPVDMIPSGAIQGHTTGTTEDITGVVHNAQTKYLYTSFLP